MSPVDLSEIQILGPYPRPVELETLGTGPAIFSLTSLPGDTDAWSSLRTTALVSALLF